MPGLALQYIDMIETGFKKSETFHNPHVDNKPIQIKLRQSLFLRKEPSILHGYSVAEFRTLGGTFHIPDCGGGPTNRNCGLYGLADKPLHRVIPNLDTKF